MNDLENQKDVENKEHIKNVYKDKSIKLLKISIGIGIISIFTYLIPLFVYKVFDFGLIFEIISFIFIILALNRIEQTDFKSGKRNIIIAMIPYGWLIIYDFIYLIANIKEVMSQVVRYYLSWDHYFYYLGPYLYDVALVALMILLYKAYSSLNIADGSNKSNNYIDTFYDNL